MSWWRRLLSRDRLESQLDAELGEHFDRLVADFIARGYDQAEARRMARLEFGGLDQVKEACRDERGTRWIDETLQDVRYGLRGFRKHRGFTIVAILTLAIGVGANLAIFNVIDAVLLRPLPVPHASELITLTRWIENNPSESFSYPQIRALADRTDVFASLAGFGHDPVYIGPPDALEQTSALWVSGKYFDTLRITPMLGRVLMPADDEPGAPVAAVISHSYWMRRFGGDPSLVGKTIVIEGQPVPIVGITPQGFSGAVIGQSGDITLAINARTVLQPENESFTSASARWILVLARPAASLSRDQFQARLDVAWRQLLERTTPAELSPEARQRTLSMTLSVDPGGTGVSRIRRDVRGPLGVAMALVTLVLLIACVNVANLLLARGATRAREVALRLAIGAGRGRIVRQQLVESLLLAMAGAAVGVLMAWAASGGIVDLLAARLAGRDDEILALDIVPDWRLFGVASFVAVAITMLFGMAPAWRASASSPRSLANSGRIAESHGRLAAALIVAQVSLSLVLVIGAGLFTRSLYNLRTLDRGFSAGNVVLVRFDARRAGFTPPELRAFNQQVLAGVERLPGIGAVSMSAITPLQGGGMSTPMTVNGVSTGLEEIYFNIVAPRFFEILETPLLAGRDFTTADDAIAQPVTIVNETFVRKHLGGASPLGQRILMPGMKQEMHIIGVVKDAAYESLRAAPPPTMYASYLQTRGRPMTLVIDARAPIADVSAAVRAEVQPRTPAAPIRVRTFAEQIETSLFQARLMSGLTMIFGGLAVLLASIGLYGLMSYTVATRTREIGVRLALGARPSRVLFLVLGSALRMVGIGVLIGLPAAWLTSRLVSGLVFGLSPTDPGIIAAAVAVLLAVGAAAAALPARRAARLDPVTAIHVE